MALDAMAFLSLFIGGLAATVFGLLLIIMAVVGAVLQHRKLKTQLEVEKRSASTSGRDSSDEGDTEEEHFEYFPPEEAFSEGGAFARNVAKKSFGSVNYTTTLPRSAPSMSKSPITPRTPPVPAMTEVIAEADRLIENSPMVDEYESSPQRHLTEQERQVRAAAEADRLIFGDLTTPSPSAAARRARWSGGDVPITTSPISPSSRDVRGDGGGGGFASPAFTGASPETHNLIHSTIRLRARVAALGGSSPDGLLAPQEGGEKSSEGSGSAAAGRDLSPSASAAIAAANAMMSANPQKGSIAAHVHATRSSDTKKKKKKKKKQAEGRSPLRKTTTTTTTKKKKKKKSSADFASNLIARAEATEASFDAAGEEEEEEVEDSTLTVDEAWPGSESPPSTSR